MTFERCYHPLELMEPLFRSVTGETRTFPVDVREVENGYILEADLPGVKEEDIAIDLEKNVLTIRAERSETEEGRYVFHERTGGRMQRAFTLTEIDENGIHADFKNGELRILLPKEKPNVRQIRIEGSAPEAAEQTESPAEAE